jgi:hypothetical protein
MSRLGRDELRKRATSFGVDRSKAACSFEAFDLVKEIGQTCDRSATVRPACRTLNRRMVTAAEPVYSTCISRQEGYENATTHRYRSASQQFHLLPAIGKWAELFERLEAGDLPRSLLPDIPERSSPSGVRCAAQNRRALDRSRPFRRLTEIRESGQVQSPFAAPSGFPLVGLELHDKFGVDKTS